MSFPNASTAMASVLIDELCRNGLSHVVVAPGSRSAALAIAADADERLEVVVALDERSAGFWAVGYGKACGRPAAVVVTSGTAVANLTPAVVEADLSHTPFLILSANRPPELRGVGANQTIDQIGMFGTRTRWSEAVGAAEDLSSSNPYWRSIVCRAIASTLGLGNPPGPVHLDLAFREPIIPAVDDGRVVGAVFESETDGRSGQSPWTGASLDPPGIPVMAFPEELRQPAGVVVIGESRFAESGAMLAHNEGWPMIAEPTSSMRGGMALRSESGDLSLPAMTTAHHLVSNTSFVNAMAPDIVVKFGRANLSSAIETYSRNASQYVVVDPDGWADPGRGSQLMLKAVPISTRFSPPARSEWLDGWQRMDASVRRVIDGILDRLDLPTEPRAARDTVRAVGEGGTLIAASSMPIRDLNLFMEPKRMRIVGNRGASGIDGFVSTALGVAANCQSAPVALAGDLSVLHDSNGFLTTPRHDCVFVVINNDGGGIFSFLPQARLTTGFERLFGTPHGRSFAKLAAFHDVGYELIETADALIPAIELARQAGGVGLVEVRTDRQANMDLHRDLSEGVNHAIDRLIP